MENKVKISTGNSKLGTGVWNVSVSPIIGCASGVPCTKECYAMKSYKQYPNVRAAWDHNLRIKQNNRYDFFYDITQQLRAAKRKPKFFRWYVAGDIDHHAEIYYMFELAHKFPETHFLLYTKNYKEVNYFFDYHKEPVPANFALYFSKWEGYKMPNPYEMPVAHYVPKGEEVPERAFVCPSNCKACQHCFIEQTAVAFKQH